jgi:hypothetical protein
MKGLGMKIKLLLGLVFGASGSVVAGDFAAATTTNNVVRDAHLTAVVHSKGSFNEDELKARVRRRSVSFGSQENVQAEIAKRRSRFEPGTEHDWYSK